jgi:hypothetical protein
LLELKSISNRYVFAFVAVGLILVLFLSVFVFQHFAGQGQVSNQKDALQSDVLNPLNVTDPANTDESTPTSTPFSSPTPTPIPIPVVFTINGSSSVLNVNVDLNDGINREEAVLVAQQLLAYAHSNYTFELKSAEVDDAGVWTVSLPWGAVSPDGYQESHGHFFVATIDPATRTVDFSTCF